MVHEPELVCSCCAPGTLARLGEDVTEVLEKIPARLKVIRHVRPRYACRVWPERKGRPVAVDLPTLHSAEDLVAALSAVTGAVSAGDLSPEEGQAVAAIMEMQRRAIETADLERRVAALETKGTTP